MHRPIIVYKLWYYVHSYGSPYVHHDNLMTKCVLWSQQPVFGCDFFKPCEVCNKLSSAALIITINTSNVHWVWSYHVCSSCVNLVFFYGDPIFDFSDALSDAHDENWSKVS